MRNCSRLSSNSSRCDCCWALSSCNCANASAVALSLAGPFSWASASRIIQSVRQSSLVSGLKESSLSSLARMFWKYWAASGQLPFSQRQHPMLQASVQLSGSISTALLYSSRALLRFPVSSKPSPSSVQSLAEAQALRSARLSEMNSQCLTDSSKRPFRLSTLPSALCVSRLSFWKGSSASPLLKCAQQMRRASWRKRSSSSPRLRHSINLRLCLSRSLSLSSPIFSSACCSSPDSISRMPSASVRNISASQSTGLSGSKDSKMLSILASAAFCADFLRVRFLMEPSQSFELCSQFLASLRQCAICWLISSAMSQSLRWSSSLSSSRLRSTLAVELSRKTESLLRLSLAMRLPVRWSTRWKRACASSARSWQNLWNALEFLVSMELRRQMARLKAASGSCGSMARTFRQLLMAWSVCPSFLQQMPMLMRELRQRGLLVSAASMMKPYSLMASSFWPLMRQRLARLQWLIASPELMARAVRQQRLASTYFPVARQQQPMLQQA